MSIFVNQSGFSKNAVKKAVINGSAKEFYILDANSTKVLEGKIGDLSPDLNSGEAVSEIEFTQLQACGVYSIKAGEDEAIFYINDEADRAVLDSLCKAYYYLRCGVDLEEKYAGKFVHKACHCRKVHVWNDKTGIELEANGGWHDAGDYGRYITAGAVAAAQLLYAWKLFPKAFINQNLNIPESGSAVPDILEECRVELEWIMKLQREDGGVYHKLTTAQHAPMVMPEEDVKQLFMLPVSSMATADLAAVCALAAGIYREYDGGFADKLEEAATKSMDWLLNNREFVAFKNPEGCGTGEYGEWQDTDNRFWAAAEMYALTGDKEYKKYMLECDKDLNLTALGYGNVAGLGALACIFNECMDGEYRLRCKNAYLSRAEELKGISEKNGYGDAMLENDYHWGSNMVLMQTACIFAIADYLIGDEKYKPYVQAQCDVLLGRNPLGISYVSNIGEYSIQHPHLRPVFADGIEECIPGMVSGGPNRHLSDPFAKRLLEAGTAPMKCFADDYMCYSLNEITIYWNSPAVFAWSYLLRDAK